MKNKQEDLGYIPSQEEIKNACKNFQQSWSEEEFFKRANIKKKNYTVPTCDLEPSCNEFSIEETIYRHQ